MGSRQRGYDRIVVGAGAVGTATAYHLSRSPGRTLVLERFQENHALGSSHGSTRILRTAYSEGAAYVPLVLRARRLWTQLAREAKQEIFRPTGVLMSAVADSPALRSARASARRYGLPHQDLDAGNAHRRFPTFRFAPGDGLLWDPGGGVLWPERAIAAYRRLAHDAGVKFRWHSPVRSWRRHSDGRIVVKTSQREYATDSLVLTSGAWLPSLVPGLHLPLRVEQQTVYWFGAQHPPRAPFRTMPAFVSYLPEGGYFYGTPDVGTGVKVGGNAGQRVRDPGRRPPSSARELHSVQRFVRARLPGLSMEPRRSAPCLYTNTPDKNFIVDLHPEEPRVILVSACSGHGFKFASVMGELVAKAARTGMLAPSLRPFHLGRFTSPGTLRSHPT